MPAPCLGHSSRGRMARPALRVLPDKRTEWVAEHVGHGSLTDSFAHSRMYASSLASRAPHKLHHLLSRAQTRGHRAKPRLGGGLRFGPNSDARKISNTLRSHATAGARGARLLARILDKGANGMLGPHPGPSAPRAGPKCIHQPTFPTTSPPSLWP